MAVVGRNITEDAKKMRARGPAEMQLGQLLVMAGRLTEGDVARVVHEQQRHHLRFGDTARQLGLVTGVDVEEALARQYEYTYIRPADSKLAAAIVAAHHPFGVQSEALRALRTQLMLRWFNERSKVLAVVAPREDAGGSALTANLAVVFAQLGERTLVIDANLRAPRQQQLFGLNPSLGLAGILTGRAAFKEAAENIQPFDNLFVITAGPEVPNPQELLGRTMFSYTIETAPAAFDVVLIDCPPAMEYADAQLIAAQSKGCLVTSRRHRSKVADLSKSEQLMSSAGAAVLGCVICD